MELKELGATGVKIPEIGLGTWEYRGGVEPLRRGIALGAFLVDTAEMYSTEDVVGEAVKEQRAKVFIASKVLGSNLRYDEVLRAAENSLKRLGTDYIDLYQLHWPNPSIPIKETMRAMEALVDMGKVRFIGVSNFWLEELKEALDAMVKYPIVANQVLFNLFDREVEESLLPYCEENKITVMAYSPLATGQLTWSSRPKKKQGMDVLHQIVRETGKTVAQVCLNFLTAKPGVVAIPKSNSVEHVEENCRASGWRLSREQIEALDRAFR